MVILITGASHTGKTLLAQRMLEKYKYPYLSIYILELDCRIMSWGPLAEGRNGFFTNELLGEIGKKYGKSIPQVALRWLLQRGVIIIPKSTHKERMAENLNIFDFELTADDMARIQTLDTGKSLFFDHHDGEVTKMFMGWRGLV